MCMRGLAQVRCVLRRLWDTSERFIPDLIPPAPWGCLFIRSPGLREHDVFHDFLRSVSTMAPPSWHSRSEAGQLDDVRDLRWRRGSIAWGLTPQPHSPLPAPTAVVRLVSVDDFGRVELLVALKLGPSDALDPGILAHAKLHVAIGRPFDQEVDMLTFHFFTTNINFSGSLIATTASRWATSSAWQVRVFHLRAAHCLSVLNGLHG
jgi:hypothetical protein